MEIRFRALEPEDVEVRVAQVGEKAVSLLLYKTARADMAMLDEAVGPMNWQRRHEFKDGKLYCSVGIRGDDGWVWKEDVGDPSSMSADKGQASDAFKRACFNWGIGRELYTAPDIWVPRGKCKRVRKGKNGREQVYDDFRVTEMAVEDGRIVKLTVCNMSDRCAVVYGTAAKERPEAPQKPAEAAGASQSPAKRRMWESIKKWAELHGRTPESVLEGIRKRPDWADDDAFYERVAAEFEADLP